jgi:hypothetical protein
VVLDLDGDAQLYEGEGHLAAQVLVGADPSGHREVPFLVPGTVAAAPGLSGCPHALDRLDVVVAFVLVLIESCSVEDVELEFRAPVGDVGDVGRLQVGLRLRGDVARIA